MKKYESTVKIYVDRNLNIEKNMMIEDIETYFQTVLTWKQLTMQQFFKHKLDTQIDIDQPSETQGIDKFDFFNSSTYNNATYLSIKNQWFDPEEENPSVHDVDTYPVYYYVMKRELLSRGAIRYYLRLDVLNTFKYGSNYQFGWKTSIQREHRDRLKAVPSHSGSYYRIVDEIDEGFNPTLHKSEENNPYYEETGADWNLVYAQAKDTQPDEENPKIDSYLLPDEKVTFIDHFSTETASLTVNEYYFLTGYNKTDNSARYNALVYDSNDPNNYIKYKEIGNILETGLIFQYISATNVKLWEFTIADVTGTINTVSLGTFSWIRFDFINNDSANPNLSLKHRSSIPSNVTGLISASSIQINESYFIPAGLPQLNRYTAELKKILKIPYSPFEMRKWFSLSNNYYIMPIECELDNIYQGESFKYLRLIPNTYERFENKIVPTNGGAYLSDLVLDSVSPDIQDLRKDKYESKLYNSQFRNNKVVYDSFGFVFQNELMKKSLLEDTYGDLYNSLKENTFTFVHSTSYISRFLFSFPNYKCKDFATEDYHNVMPVSRNNELPAFNNEYVNYMNSGYNYDKKSYDLNRAAAITGATANALNGAINVGTKIATENYIGAITSGISTANALVQNITAIEVSEQQWQKKLATLKYQGTTVSTSDDLDLLKYYSNNRLKMVKYSVSEQFNSQLSDLFYFYGYKTVRNGIPNMNNRTWFNFVQCISEFTIVMGISDECLNELSNKFANGVTIYHKNVIQSVPTWNLAQTKENWETSIL